LKRAWVLVLLAGCGGEGAQEAGGAPATEAPAAWFADASADSGVSFVHQDGATSEKHLPESMGAGGALFDADEDGDLDLYLVQGGPMRLPGPGPGTFAEPPGPLPPNELWLNDGRARFRDATRESGDAADTGYGMGVAVGDADGDGHADLYVANLGADVFVAGDGRGRFTRREAGLGDERWTTAALFFDADGDGDLDLYVTGYVEIDLAHPEWCGLREPGWRSVCHPDQYPGLQDRFWRNRGDGSFQDATEAAGLADSWGKGLGALASDLDADGDLDLYVANDSTENRLWANDGRGRFVDATLLSGTGVDGRGATEAGMGLASGDVDGDLDLELFVTNFDDESNTLYANEGGLLFGDRTAESGLEAPSRVPVGFGTVFADFDQDGDLDLAVANGHIIDNIQLYHDGKTHAQRAQLFANDGRGVFRELRAAAGALGARPFVGRGLYSGDVDGDGDLDLVLTECGGPAHVFLNEAPAGGALVLAGLPAGTQVELRLASGRRLLREAGPQPSYFGACAAELHAGLGEDSAVALLVRAPWSEPSEVRLEPPARNERLVLRQGEGGWLVGSRAPFARRE
jgi:hypothetical protein